MSKPKGLGRRAATAAAGTATAAKAVEATRKAASVAADKATQAAGEQAERIASTAGDLAEAARQRAVPALTQAAERAREFTGQAAAPRVSALVDRVSHDITPRIVEAVVAALAATEPVREEAVTRGKTAVAALRGQVPPAPPKRHWGRRVVSLAAVLAAAFAGWRMWQQRTARAGQWAEPTGTAVTPPAAAPGSPAAAPGSPTATPGAGGAPAGAGTSAPDGTPPGSRPLGSVTSSDAGGASAGETLADAVDESADRPAGGQPGQA
jgi:hypothetical protein